MTDTPEAKHPAVAKRRFRRGMILLAIAAVLFFGLFFAVVAAHGVSLLDAAGVAGLLLAILAGATSALYGYVYMIRAAFRDGSLYWTLGLIFLPWLCVPLFPLARWQTAKRGLAFFAPGVCALLLMQIAFILAGSTGRRGRADGVSFIEFVVALEGDGKRFSDKAVASAEGRMDELFAITATDISRFASRRGIPEDNVDAYPLVILSQQLARSRECLDYGDTHYRGIQHPDVRLCWAVLLVLNGRDNVAARTELVEAIKKLDSVPPGSESPGMLNDILVGDLPQLRTLLKVPKQP